MSRLAHLTSAITLFAALTLSAPAELAAAETVSLPRVELTASRRGELRGAWVGAGYGRDWPAIAKSLRDNGFNALFANVSTGGAAFYPSAVLPVVEGGAPGRDELSEALRAARDNGIELHAWRVDWALHRAPRSLLAELESAGRLQRNRRGELGRDDPEVGADWLCPSDPENRKLEAEAALELVRRYDISGLQFDYMRFPNANYCFCDHCRSRFQEEAGRHVERWPDDVLPGGPLADRWQGWRRDLLTGFLSEIREQIHRIKPELAVSLAARPDLEAARREEGQDWASWVRDGLFDFVCPMDYAADAEQLTRWLRPQMEAVRGEVPVYVGLGAFLMDSSGTLIEQVEAARACGADGFVAFSYFGGDFQTWLPRLGLTVAAGDPDPMPHHGPPAAFAFSAAEDGPPISGASVAAGAPLLLHIAIGDAPAEESEERDSGGAEQAASILRRTTEARSPVAAYEPPPSPAAGFGERPRVSGRIVAETPGGLSLLTLGAFDTDFRFARTLRFPAPAGPFRVAVYGEARDGNRSARAFVRRSPLMVGVLEQEPTGRPAGAD